MLFPVLRKHDAHPSADGEGRILVNAQEAMLGYGQEFFHDKGVEQEHWHDPNARFSLPLSVNITVMFTCRLLKNPFRLMGRKTSMMQSLRSDRFNCPQFIIIQSVFYISVSVLELKSLESAYLEIRLRRIKLLRP